MNDDDVFDALDRRARSAVDALAVATRETEIPELPAAGDRAASVRKMPLLVAAAVLLVALIGATVMLSADDDPAVDGVADDESVVETRDGPTRLALEDPAAEGFTLFAAFDSSSIRRAEPIEIEAIVQGPTTVDDPWAAAVVVIETPYDPYLLNGEVVDVGGPQAAYRPDAGLDTVVVRDGEKVRQLMSARVGRDDLTALAAEAVRSGWDPLPGHAVLHRGPTYDVFADVAMASLYPTDAGRAGLAYRHPGDDDFVITWTPAGDARWRASFTLSEDPVETSVRDRPAVVATTPQVNSSMTTASWLEPDGTLIQVATRGDIERVLDVIEGRSTRIDAERLRSLVERHPAPDDQPLIDLGDSTWFGDGEGSIMASVRADTAEGEVAVELRENAGRHQLHLLISDASGTSGSGSGLVDLRSTVMSRSAVGGPDQESWSEVLIGGVTGPGLQDLAVVDSSTSEPVPLLVSSSAPVPGTDRVVFLATVDAALRDTPLVVVADTDDHVIRYRV